MTAANRVRVTVVRESTLGTTPTTPRMRSSQFTEADPQFKRTYVDPDDIRSDRNLTDPIPVMAEADVNLKFNLRFPIDNFPESEFMRAAMLEEWMKTPEKYNDGTADSIITNVAAGSPDIITVSTTGVAFLDGHITLHTGFTNAANNGVFFPSASSSTTITFGNGVMVTEAAPPAEARIKIVGWRGGTTDISATATGLAAATTNFITAGFMVGMWIKIGGSTGPSKFATTALNSYARVIGVTASALTLDNRPTGWTTDAGTGQAIRIWFGDFIKNGVNKKSVSIEFGYMGQDTPSYVLCAGQVPNIYELTFASRAVIKGSVSFLGMSGALSTTTVDAAPDELITESVMAANVNVGRMSENGTKLVMPNCAREFSISINNNLRKIECIDDDAPVGINEGDCTVTGKLGTYYGSTLLYTKFLDGTPTSLNAVVERNNRAFIVDVPKATYRSGGPPVTGKNTDVMLSLDWQASLESTYFNCSVIFNRLWWVEN